MGYIQNAMPPTAPKQPNPTRALLICCRRTDFTHSFSVHPILYGMTNDVQFSATDDTVRSPLEYILTDICSINFSKYRVLIAASIPKS